MRTLDLCLLPRVSALQHHGALQAAYIRLNGPVTQDALAKAARAADLKLENGVWQGDDGSWVALAGTKLVKGYGARRFRSDPRPISELPTFAPARVAHGHLSFFWIADPTPENMRALRMKLSITGFEEISPNYYVHADGSWVAIAPGGTVERGFLGQRAI